MTQRKSSSELPDNIYQDLALRCLHAGTNITAVCKKAGVSRATLDRWRKSEPNSLRIYRKIVQTIEAQHKSK